MLSRWSGISLLPLTPAIWNHFLLFLTWKLFSLDDTLVLSRTWLARENPCWECSFPPAPLIRTLLLVRTYNIYCSSKRNSSLLADKQYIYQMINLGSWILWKRSVWSEKANRKLNLTHRTWKTSWTTSVLPGLPDSWDGGRYLSWYQNMTAPSPTSISIY